MKQLIWINGAFGAGKTSLANEIKSFDNSIILFDPEKIGDMLRNIVSLPKSKDYQDLPIWRRLTGLGIVEFQNAYSCTVVVPMTLVVKQYFDEIFSMLEQNNVQYHHFFLNVSKSTLEHRIRNQIIHSHDHKKDEMVRNWRLAQIDRCLNFADNLPSFTRVLDSENLSVSALRDNLLKKI